ENVFLKEQIKDNGKKHPRFYRFDKK
ncbi:MAG: hypothetical protein ACI9V9_000758, partial [Oleispira sp.]